MLLPNRVSAFWFFGPSADAAESTFTPSSSTPLLKAATNVDPNPDKGLSDNIQMSDNAMLAYAGPSGTTADIASSTPADRISVYVVRQGDTLSEIAKMFDVSVNTIVWANNLSGPKAARPGDTLIILPISGVKHTVVKGNTLKSVAKKYSSDANEIAQFNGLDPEEPLSLGTVIIIPGGEVAAIAPVRNTSPRNIREPYLGGSGAAQSGYYGNPVPGARVTQGIHGWNGIDLGAARGTPVYAAADGSVIIARGSGWNGGYGNYVVITHNNGSQTLYSHMSSAVVTYGQTVAKGQIIGYVGNTGLSTGPHLHFEVRGAANPLRTCTVGRACAPQ